MTSTESFYFAILNLLNQNKTPSQISKELNLSKQNIYYYTRELKKLGFIKKEKNIWQVLNSKKIDLEHAIKRKDKMIRGHAFIWVAKPNRFYDWKLLLDKNKIKYNLVRGYTPRLFINEKKVWLGKDTITIYENKSFYGKNAIESRKYAVFELQETLRLLMSKLGIDFKYFFKVTREHFGMIKNELARQCNKNGEKIVVRDYLDGEYLWIDDSESLGELETGGKGFTKDRAKLNMEVQNWFNDMKKTDFKVTPSFLMEQLNKQSQIMGGIQQNQLIFDANMSSHLEVLENIGKAITELREVIKNGNNTPN